MGVRMRRGLRLKQFNYRDDVRERKVIVNYIIS